MAQDQGRINLTVTKSLLQRQSDAVYLSNQVNGYFSVHFTLSVSLMRKHVGMLFLVLGMRRLSGYEFAQFW